MARLSYRERVKEASGRLSTRHGVNMFKVAFTHLNQMFNTVRRTGRFAATKY
jgi:hypothetical protein